MADTGKYLESLYKLLGSEVQLDDPMRALSFAVRALRPPVVGALQVTCSDESEKECCDAFQRRFVQQFLPSLKFGGHFPFRTANLGGRYEWGSIRIAENHFAAQPKKNAFKVMVVKINAHVSVVKGTDGPVYGEMERYQQASQFCGTLQAMLEGADQPFRDEMYATFHSDGKDLLKIILNPEQVDSRVRNLYAAALSARLQARKAVIDIQSYEVPHPTIYLVLACSTLNRQPGSDTEVVCGVYAADFLSKPPVVSYRGLGDDPAEYRLEDGLHRLQIRDGEVHTSRDARDHRQLVLTEWRKHGKNPFRKDARIESLRARVVKDKHRLHPYAPAILKSLLAVLLELSPIPAAVLLFSQGMIEIHHVYRLHKISREVGDDEDTRQILADFHRRVESLPPERAQKIIEVLLHEYSKI